MMRRALAAVPPASGAVVMATGIVSIDLSSAGRETLSRVLLCIGTAVWLVLGALLVARAVLDRPRALREATSPAALTGVAGTAVLGTRYTLLGWRWAGVALLIVAFGIWLVLLGPVLRHWATPTVGVSFVLAVATQALAVLAATLATSENARWLIDAALVAFALGLAFYAFVISRFDWRQLVIGRGDHWVSGGALAISALAASKIALAAKDLGVISSPPKIAQLVLWAAAMVWLPALLGFELLFPRLEYDIRRWATAFPLGMFASCSFAVGAAVDAAGITRFARIWVWVAFALWLVLFTALVRRCARALHQSRAGQA
ncbi:MAG TPA: tellurite resistance/C4-dicarboxylate transporter family protein [Solirubrobacteraceae bacterium]|nr:tellurite resistance/C4-dicarboxylate transporter family protein [Solirubrobacteraceae bacterium]